MVRKRFICHIKIYILKNYFIKYLFFKLLGRISIRGITVKLFLKVSNYVGEVELSYYFVEFKIELLKFAGKILFYCCTYIT